MIAVFEILPNLSFTSPTIGRYNETVKTVTVVLRIQGEEIREEPERKLNTSEQSTMICSRKKKSRIDFIHVLYKPRTY